MDKALLQQALDALNDSVDVVQNEHARYAEMYQGYPSRQSQIDLYQQAYERHKIAIEALQAAVAQPVQPESKPCFMCHGKGWHYMAHAYPPGMAPPNTKMKCTQCIAQPATKCKKCAGQMKSGQAIAQTFSAGLPDFPGDAVGVTISPGGPGKLIDCLKCEGCGWSVTGAPPADQFVDANKAIAPLTELQRMQIIGNEFPPSLVQPLVIQKIDTVCQAIEAAMIAAHIKAEKD